MTTRVFKGGHNKRKENRTRPDHGWGRKQATLNDMFSNSVDSEPDFDINRHLDEKEEREIKIKLVKVKEELIKNPPPSPPKKLKERSKSHQFKSKSMNDLPEKRRQERRIHTPDLKANEIELNKLLMDEENALKERDKLRKIERKKLADDILKKREIRSRNDAESDKLKDVINSTKYSRQSTWRESRDKYIASRQHADVKKLISNTEDNLIDFIEERNKENPVIGTIDGKFIIKRHSHIEVDSFFEQKEFTNEKTNMKFFRSPFE